jgi:O-antigen/teichoic acid export membrane protein
VTVLLGESDPREGTVLGTFLANVKHGGIRGFVFMVNTVILVPLLMKSMGKQQFAILALVTPFLRYGFNGVFDFGIAAGIVRHTSRSVAAGDIEGTNGYVSSSLALYVGFGAALISLYYLLWPSLMPLLIRTNAEFYGSARIVFEFSLWVYCLFSMSNPFFTLLMGVQKVEATHWIGTASLLIELGSILVLVPFGLSLSRVMWVYGANAALSLLLSVLLAWHYFPSLRLTWRLVSWSRVKDILGYGVQLSATTLAAVLSPIFDKLILARYVGLSEVALYEGAARLIDLLRRATQLFLLPLFPMASAREKTSTEPERRSFYAQAFSANLLMSSALYLVPASLAFGIFGLWLGPESRPAAVAFLVLSGVAFCQVLVGPVTMIFAGTGRLRPLMTTALLGMFINLIVGPVLAHYLGFAGVLAGTVVAYGIVSLIFLAWTLRIDEFAIPLRQLFRLGGLTILAGLLPGVALSLGLHLMSGPLGWPKLLAAGITATGSLVAFSLAQSEYRRMVSRVFCQVREGLKDIWSKRGLSNA